ncbi:STAS/SEC14 domain-containing protein [Sorangium sp. So ce131]|uniref:STAS/SEC14 domain-containing protein n=1 Tax=Sorangium sp. So ce131 TaxID=3133282 RepID=UPI003F61B942
MKYIGKHTACVGDVENTFEVAFRGDLSVEDAKQLLDFMTSESAGWSYVLLTGDLSEMGKLSPDVRKTLATLGRRLPPVRGIVYYRASFAVRVTNELVIRAYALLTGVDVAFHFADDAAEARAWLARRQEEIASKAQHQVSS